MSTKSFSEVRKPGRRPTPEEIMAFEETGRAIARETRITAKAERHESVKAETSEHGNTETSVDRKQVSQVHANPSLQESYLSGSRESGHAGSRVAVEAETMESADTETQKAEPTVRLTIDLPESVHTRFKAACAITRRKMVEEVRGFIEQRTAELEGESRG
jgi:hypothetical protein